MADPITNLAANWVPSVGVQLSWTAADDVTADSSYLLAVAVAPNPSWTPAGRFDPVALKAPGASRYSRVAPVTQYTFPWTAMVALGMNAAGLPTNLPPLSISFQIVHLDASGVLSDPLTVVSCPPAVNPSAGLPHLPNVLTLDSFGQFITTDQDSFEEIANCVEVIVGTDLGQRTALPSFGVEDLAFAGQDAAKARVRQAIGDWEPRADDATINVSVSDSGLANVSVHIPAN